jgi:transposase InsO family protein
VLAIIEEWSKHYYKKRLHSALGYRPQASETNIPLDQKPIMQ